MQELDYHIPPEQPPVLPPRRWIGLAGFLVYAVIGIPLDALLIATLVEGWRWRDVKPIAIVGSIGLFCTWRAIAGLMQFFKR